MQTLIFVVLALYILLAVVVLKKVSMTPKKSLSMHIGASRQTILLGRVLMPLVAVLLVLFVYSMQLPDGVSGGSFRLLFVVSSVLVALAGIVPYGGSVGQRRAHDIFAWSFAATLPYISVLAVPLMTSLLAQTLLIFIAIIQISLILMTYHKPARAYFLYYQNAYVVLYGLALFVIAFM